ncbi:MAG: hypothetical protein GX859_10445 [Corynebacterium humireducens]|uniref:Uncharacterized protein n=1 Tax=Corynebacterium humireducens TaxID=1223514 RepID=A0A7X6SWM7_9CORY|nr:hypothetical protein [Corynebacterium humireducens]
MGADEEQAQAHEEHDGDLPAAADEVLHAVGDHAPVGVGGQALLDEAHALLTRGGLADEVATREGAEQARPAGHEEHHHGVGGEAHPHPDLLRAGAACHDGRDDQRRETVAHEHVELEDEDVVQQAVEDEHERTPRVAAGPGLAAAHRRLPLDLQPDAEHDGQQSDELAVGEEVEQDVGDGVERRQRPLSHRALGGGVHGGAGEEPDVGQQGAEDRDAPEHVEGDDAPSWSECVAHTEKRRKHPWERVPRQQSLAGTTLGRARQQPP